MLLQLFKFVLRLFSVICVISLPWQVFADYVVYVPIEIKTCTGCADKIITTPPNRISADGRHGFIQVVACQSYSSSVRMNWSGDGFKALLGNASPNPVKTIEAPCICAKINQAAAKPQECFSFVCDVATGKPIPGSAPMTLPEMVRWYNYQLVMSLLPQNNVVDPATGRPLYGVIKLLPGDAKAGMSAVDLIKQSSPSKGNIPSGNPSIQGDSATAFLFNANVQKPKQRTVISSGVRGVPKAPLPNQASFIDINDEKTRYDLRRVYVSLQALNEIRGLSISDQMRLLQERNVAIGLPPGIGNISKTVLVPPDPDSSWGDNVEVNFGSHSPHHFHSGRTGRGVKILFSDQRRAQQERVNRFRDVVDSDDVTWDYYYKNPEQCNKNFLLERVAFEGNYYQEIPTQALFDRYDLYEHDAYLDLLKSLPDYDQQILALRIKMIADKDKRKEVDDPWYPRRYHIFGADTLENRKTDNTSRKVKFSELVNHLSDEVNRRHEQIRQLAQEQLNRELERQFQEHLAAKIVAAYKQREAEIVACKKEETAALDAITKEHQQVIKTAKHLCNQEISVFEDKYRKADFERFIKQIPLDLHEDMFDDLVEKYDAVVAANPKSSWAEESAIAMNNMVDYFQQSLGAGDTESAQRWAQRLNALKTGKNECRNPIRYNEEYKNFLAAHGFDPNKQRGVEYYQPIAQIEYETNDVLHSVYENEKRYGHFYDVKHLNACSIWAVKAANEVCFADHITRTLPAYHLLDFAHACQTAATKTGDHLSLCDDAVRRTGAFIEHVTNRTMQLLGNRAKEILKNPMPYAGEILLCAAMPQVAFARFLYSAYADRKEYVIFFSGMQQLIATNPAEAMAQLATFGVEFALTGRLMKDANQISARAKEFGRLFTQETRVATVTAAAGMEASTLNPLSKAVGGAAEKVKQAGAATKTAFANLRKEVHVTCKQLSSGSKPWECTFVEDILKNAHPGRKTRGPTIQYIKPGKYNDVIRDFESLKPTNVHPFQTATCEGFVGELPNGKKLVARTFSRDGRPTLEIQDGSHYMTVRYDEKL